MDDSMDMDSLITKFDSLYVAEQEKQLEDLLTFVHITPFQQNIYNKLTNSEKYGFLILQQQLKEAQKKLHERELEVGRLQHKDLVLPLATFRNTNGVLVHCNTPSSFSAHSNLKQHKKLEELCIICHENPEKMIIPVELWSPAIGKFSIEIIVEDKKGHQGTNADPLVEAICYYRRYCCVDKNNNVNPCLLLVLEASTLIIYGCVTNYEYKFVNDVAEYGKSNYICSRPLFTFDFAIQEANFEHATNVCRILKCIADTCDEIQV